MREKEDLQSKYSKLQKDQTMHALPQNKGYEILNKHRQQDNQYSNNITAIEWQQSPDNSPGFGIRGRIRDATIKYIGSGKPEEDYGSPAGRGVNDVALHIEELEQKSKTQKLTPIANELGVDRTYDAREGYRGVDRYANNDRYGHAVPATTKAPSGFDKFNFKSPNRQ